MLVKISWRNVFRHPVRSMVIMLAVALGLWAGILVMALSFGMLQQRFDMMIGSFISHIQIHHPSFHEERDVKFQVPERKEIMTELEMDKKIKAFAPRTLLFGFAASAAGSRGVEIRGIDPQGEDNLTSFSEKITSGTFLSSGESNRIVISERLAKLLNVEIDSRMVLTFQDLHGEIVSAAFRVEGIYRTADVKLDERFIYADIHDLGKLLGGDMVINEIAILLHDKEITDSLSNKLKSSHPLALIRPWHEISPEMRYMKEISAQTIYIFIIIILIGLAFGILNTMQMSVFERTRELGMLKAIGMNKTRIFTMIMLETIFLSMCGGLTGIATGFITVRFLAEKGIDFSAFADALATFGMEAIIYPDLSQEYYLNLVLLVLFTAIAASIYPAIKAVKVNPANITKN
jgi:putative ABC transport system permease protein